MMTNALVTTHNTHLYN